MYYYGNSCQGYGNCCTPSYGCGCNNGIGSGAAIILVLFILLVIVIGARPTI